MYESTKNLIATFVAIVLLIIFLGSTIWGWQYFKVFKAEYSGKAVLAEAEYSRQVAVKQAQAYLDSAKLLADAEVERAKGVKTANEIIAGSLKGHEEYLRYLWIQNVSVGDQVIYVPTEAGLPIILEAGKR